MAPLFNSAAHLFLSISILLYRPKIQSVLGSLWSFLKKRCRTATRLRHAPPPSLYLAPMAAAQNRKVVSGALIHASIILPISPVLNATAFSRLRVPVRRQRSGPLADARLAAAKAVKAAKARRAAARKASSALSLSASISANVNPSVKHVMISSVVGYVFQQEELRSPKNAGTGGLGLGETAFAKSSVDRASIVDGPDDGVGPGVEKLACSTSSMHLECVPAPAWTVGNDIGGNLNACADPSMLDELVFDDKFTQTRALLDIGCSVVDAMTETGEICGTSGIESRLQVDLEAFYKCCSAADFLSKLDRKVAEFLAEYNRICSNDFSFTCPFSIKEPASNDEKNGKRIVGAFKPVFNNHSAPNTYLKYRERAGLSKDLVATEFSKLSGTTGVNAGQIEFGNRARGSCGCVACDKVADKFICDYIPDENDRKWTRSLFFGQRLKAMEDWEGHFVDIHRSATFSANSTHLVIMDSAYKCVNAIVESARSDLLRFGVDTGFAHIIQVMSMEELQILDELAQ